MKTAAPSLTTNSKKKRSMAKKKTETVIVRCYDCKHAYLMQEKGNPVIALCKITIAKNGSNGQREVAGQKRRCDNFARGYPSPTIFPMIPAGEQQNMPLQDAETHL